MLLKFRPPFSFVLENLLRDFGSRELERRQKAEGISPSSNNEEDSDGGSNFQFLSQLRNRISYKIGLHLHCWSERACKFDPLHLRQ